MGHNLALAGQAELVPVFCVAGQAPSKTGPWNNGGAIGSVCVFFSQFCSICANVNYSLRRCLAATD